MERNLLRSFVRWDLIVFDELKQSQVTIAGLNKRQPDAAADGSYCVQLERHCLHLRSFVVAYY